MHVHSVFFWLKSDTTAEERAAFEKGLALLLEDPSARVGHFGAPADTHRGVVDRSYDYGLTLIFDDLAGHDSYQAGPVHQKFLQDHQTKWQRALVFDVQS
jgi:hypothetical protein